MSTPRRASALHVPPPTPPRAPGDATDPARKARPSDAAIAAMEAVSFRPSVPFPGSGARWPGVCLRCGHPGAPSLKQVRQGNGPCAYCAGRRVDSAVAEGRMLAADFAPSTPFPGSLAPWPGVCLRCGQPGRPRYHNVARGHGPCGYCSGHRTDSALAWGLMLAADFLPLAPFPGAQSPWPGLCLRCGRPGDALLGSVRRGRGACARCRPTRRSDAAGAVRSPHVIPAVHLPAVLDSITESD